jgi:hypothetical protein
LIPRSACRFEATCEHSEPVGLDIVKPGIFHLYKIHTNKKESANSTNSLISVSLSQISRRWRSPGAADLREHARLGSAAMREVVPLSPEAAARRLKDGTPSAACSPIKRINFSMDGRFLLNLQPIASLSLSSAFLGPYRHGFSRRCISHEIQLNWNHLIGVLVIS